MLTTLDPINLLSCFRLHHFGPHDPTCVLTTKQYIIGAQTPAGAGVLELRNAEPQNEKSKIFEVYTHGDANKYLLANAESILGLDDHPHQLKPQHAIVQRMVRACLGLRLARMPSPFDVLVRLIFQQRVAWRDAAFAYKRMVVAYGSVSSHPSGVVIPPTPAQWAKIPPSAFSEIGIDRRRSRTIQQAARLGNRSTARVEATHTRGHSVA